MNVDELYTKLIAEEYFTEEENDCIYARYGYKDYEQLKSKGE